MKRHTLIASLLCAGAAVMSLSAQAASAETCAGKEREIQQQLEQARRHNNAAQVRGLESALKSVRSHCNDADLHAKRQQNVTELKAKVSERERELRESMQSGADADKIQKRRDKLNEAQQELSAAQRALPANAHP